MQYTYNANGGGYMRVIAGQSYHVAGHNPYTLGTGLEKRQSDYVLGLYYEPSTMFRFLAQNRFDTETLDVQRTDLFTYVGYGPVQATRQLCLQPKESRGFAAPDDAGLSSPARKKSWAHCS